MVEILWMLTLFLLSTALVLGFLRLARGPRLPDRVIALDLITIIVMGFIIVTAVRTRQTAFLDAAIVLALISFLGTVAFAYAIERRV
ncbi:MAG TPA: pesticidal protein Cry22Aa [Anaerolinea thermolimosa]|uniref:Pesticidal protein Cry22Aa n=2 Tax=Anaerolinea thermolimosa TaxID=229919 RepID=A0A3D1JFQ0_9CHLR|nr:pesticidal protein Cry22Aa [Anaerolinea thermolimosa]